MSICVIGFNYKTAPIDLREKVYFSLDKLSLYLQDLLSRGHAHEGVLLSTCNRSELYCETDDVLAVRDWFCAQTTLPPELVLPSIYVYHDQEAVQHMMQVACGLDSMILGEPQILGQMKEAFSESCTAGAVGALFHRLFQQIFSVAKEIRTTTAIGACPVSVASAAAHFAKQQVANFHQANVLLIGAGDTTELLLRYLTPHLENPMTIVNRSMETAAALMDGLAGRVFDLSQLETAIAGADIVFSATSSAVPLVNQAIVAAAMRERTHKPLWLFDIAVPRDIDPAVMAVPNVSLYCIDDLKAIIENNRKGREHAAKKADEMIYNKSRDFIAELASFDKVAHTISAYRGQIEALCRSELAKAKYSLCQGDDPSQVLEDFARAFTKKLMHAPSVQLRQAGAEGRFEVLRFAKQLFSLSDPEIGLS